MNSRRLLAIGAGALVAAGLVAGCGSSDSASADGGLSGAITIDGSSTVAPLTTGAAESFNADNKDVQITVGTSGTGGGFEKFCAGSTDISDASRGIKDEEAAACGTAGIKYTEFRVASDGITIAIKKGTDTGKTCVNFTELKKAWEKGSTVNNWKAIGGKDLAMKLAGPGDQSGTYDFFNETVLGKDDAGEVNPARADYAASEDDNVIVTAIEGSPGALGYFGYTYFEENADKLDDLAVKGEEGDCVKPTAETITDGTYPLSRPLFIYVNDASMARPEVKAFVKYYLTNAVTLAEDNEFVPAPQSAIDESLAKVPA
ncbi:MAG TPA: PstS family phosphate ABC transporter substrate-binding protein [Miltoncostaeales bacterium]|nr:PstS family phosphate ABC transporter substrate-binding protein [Miltoncostaeales bacterium]